MNITERLEFETAYFEATVHQFINDATSIYFKGDYCTSCYLDFIIAFYDIGI